MPPAVPFWMSASENGATVLQEGDRHGVSESPTRLGGSDGARRTR